MHGTRPVRRIPSPEHPNPKPYMLWPRIDIRRRLQTIVPPFGWSFWSVQIPPSKMSRPPKVVIPRGKVSELGRTTPLDHER